MRTVSGPTDRVVVVGAGLAGLACALHLAGTGRRVTVLEREPVWLQRLHLNANYLEHKLNRLGYQIKRIAPILPIVVPATVWETLAISSGDTCAVPRARS